MFLLAIARVTQVEVIANAALPTNAAVVFRVAHIASDVLVDETFSEKGEQKKTETSLQLLDVSTNY